VHSKHFIVVNDNSNLFYSFLPVRISFEATKKIVRLPRHRFSSFFHEDKLRGRTGRRASPCEVRKRAKSTGLPGSIPHPIGGSVANQ